MRVTPFEEVPTVNEQEMCEETKIFNDIANNRREGVCLEYDTVQEAIVKTNTICNFRTRHSQENKDIYNTNIIRRKNKVYITKESKDTVLGYAEDGEQSDLEQMIKTLRKKYAKAMVDGTVTDPEMKSLEATIIWVKNKRQYEREQKKKKLFGQNNDWAY